MKGLFEVQNPFWYNKQKVEPENDQQTTMIWSGLHEQI
ncbi:MAG: hypothetical protein K0S39_5462 [Paenibacillus sp.]|jgi:hypothetical protein|nr:hypothetical protein [Paenibacillus sp.]